MIPERDRVALRPEQATIPPGHSWNRIPVIGAVCALLGAVACAILGAANPKQFFFSWLVSFLFFLSLALGALFFVLIQYAAQGGWGIVLRRIGETIFATLPVMAALFLPVFLGLRDLYSWTAPGAAEHDALLRWKAPYLNVPFFLIRAALYFGIWSFIALLYYRGSRGQDVTGDPGVSARLRRLAGPAIIVLALTQTFASIDWIMSLTPHWYSTIFGVYFFAGSFVGFIALLSVVAVAMRRAGLLDTVISAEHLHDIGKLLFAFTAFWAYIAFSQFFLMWYANLPEETIWYKARIEGSWMTVSLFLMAGHFVVPFFYLMGRDRQAEGIDPGRRGSVAPRHALRGSLLAGHADAPSRGAPSVGSGRRRARRRRRVLRGGGELADATAGARTATRPEARRIARLRERLRSDRSPASRARAARRARGLHECGVRCTVGPIAMTGGSSVDGDDGDEVCDDQGAEHARDREQVVAGGWAGRGVGLAGRRRRRFVHHRNRHLRRESPRSQAARHGRRPRVRQEALGTRGRTRCWSSAAATPWGTSWSGSRRGSRPARPGPLPRLR